LGKIDKATEEMIQAMNIEDQVSLISLKKHREYFENLTLEFSDQRKTGISQRNAP
jgi:hypothetical protein